MLAALAVALLARFLAGLRGRCRAPTALPCPLSQLLAKLQKGLWIATLARLLDDLADPVEALARLLGSPLDPAADLLGLLG